jgi:hypothetical protein
MKAEAALDSQDLKVIEALRACREAVRGLHPSEIAQVSIMLGLLDGAPYVKATLDVQTTR